MSELQRVVIAGGTGSLGRRLSADLVASGLEVVVLTRSPRENADGTRYVTWDGRSVGDWAQELDGPGVAVVNLAGKLVDARPTAAGIAELRRSRVEATGALVAASVQAPRVQRWVQASTTAIWSDAGEQRLTETSPLPAGLPQMTGVARPWEEAAAGANTDHLTLLRTSIVLDADSPAYRRLRLLARFGLGGRVGSGQQWFSWIHHEDWLRITRGALGLPPSAGEGLLSLPDGPVVAAAPYPVRNAELMAELRRHVGNPVGLPTPAPLLKLGALALRTDPALALTGRHCTSRVLVAAGFSFRHPTLRGALDAL